MMEQEICCVQIKFKGEKPSLHQVDLTSLPPEKTWIPTAVYPDLRVTCVGSYLQETADIAARVTKQYVQKAVKKQHERKRSDYRKRAKVEDEVE